jgi:hypothetical protein
MVESGPGLRGGAGAVGDGGARQMTSCHDCQYNSRRRHATHLTMLASGPFLPFKQLGVHKIAEMEVDKM